MENKKFFKLRPPRSSSGRCPDCEDTPCICFSYLSQPHIETQSDGKLLIKFDSDWSLEEKENYLINARYALRYWAGKG